MNVISENNHGWTARFITDGREGGALPVFRTRFDIDSAVTKASLRASFLGIGTLTVNGHAVTDAVLEPGWQSYRNRLSYREHDVTHLLAPGENVIEAEVGPGWYSGPIGFFSQPHVYGRERAVIAELHVSEANGVQRTIGTDENWQWRAGATSSGELYDGEHYDARLEDTLQEPGGWHSVKSVPFDLSLLKLPDAPPVRRTETLRAEQVISTPSGATILDFGRNIVGWTRLRVQGSAGDKVTLRHAEVLEHGELGTRPLRAAAATDSYTLRGGAVEEWEPSFTYHGFRYVQVDGWPANTPIADGVEAVFIHTDLDRTGWFRTSHAGLAQLHANVVASTRGNFVSIPTDCPQRDERLGWTGDIAIFAPTAMFLYDATDFLNDWMRDVAAEQRDDGRIPIFVPEVPFPDDARHIEQFGDVRAAVWGDAATLVPTAIYDATGDPRFLAGNYAVMTRWVDGIRGAVGSDLIWREGFQFADWLDPIAPPDDPAAGATSPDLIATAYFAHSARLVARAATVLGNMADQERYHRLADDVAAAFRREYVGDDGRMSSDAQTAYAIALTLELLATDEQRAAAGKRLAELVREGGHRIGTGFVGTPLILDALTRAEALDDAYSLLLQTEVPSWLYAVSMGATTIWERWDSMLPDGCINSGEMTSFNHYALGSVAQWLHSTVAGLSAMEPGWRRIRIAPRPRGPLTDAGATHLTPFGEAQVDWVIENETLTVTATVPPGTTAVFDLEGQPSVERGPGVHTLSAPLPAHSKEGQRA
jgi:alpha-L-rhamnosidase